MDGDNNANNNANNNVNPNAQGTTGQQNNNANQPNNNSNAIDYNKIQEMIDGRNAKTEDSVLKSYFLTDAQASLQKSQLENQRLRIEKKAYDFVDELNVDIKTMPYLLKMADLNNCADKDGNVLEDTLKTALQKVIDDVPGLKKQVQGTVGITVGADTNNGTNSNNGVFDFGFTGVRPKKQN